MPPKLTIRKHRSQSNRVTRLPVPDIPDATDSEREEEENPEIVEDEEAGDEAEEGEEEERSVAASEEDGELTNQLRDTMDEDRVLDEPRQSYRKHHQHHEHKHHEHKHHAHKKHEEEAEEEEAEEESGGESASVRSAPVSEVSDTPSVKDMKRKLRRLDYMETLQIAFKGTGMAMTKIGAAKRHLPYDTFMNQRMITGRYDHLFTRYEQEVASKAGPWPLWVQIVFHYALSVLLFMQMPPMPEQAPPPPVAAQQPAAPSSPAFVPRQEAVDDPTRQETSPAPLTAEEAIARAMKSGVSPLADPSFFFNRDEEGDEDDRPDHVVIEIPQ